MWDQTANETYNTLIISVLYVYEAESGGFEPPVHCCTLPFQGSTLDHSDNSPMGGQI